MILSFARIIKRVFKRNEVEQFNMDSIFGKIGSNMFRNVRGDVVIPLLLEGVGDVPYINTGSWAK